MAVVTTDVLEQLNEELSDRIPCDTEEVCLGKQQFPGEFLITHEGATAECGQILCKVCKRAMEIIVIGMGKTFGCKGCNKDDITREEIVIRHI